MSTLTQRMVDRAALRLSRPRRPPEGGPAEPGTSRRSFLARSALVGSALAVAPARYLLRPGTAYAAITDVCGPDATCVPGGFSVFCCTISGGVNQCPPGSVPGGWWRAGTGSNWCCGGDRYYVDCQAACPSGCACDSGHFCPGCQNCTSGCYSGPSCDQRNVCRIRFRYGQCNQQIACTGNVLCRMVSCTPPWQIAGLNCAAGPDKTDPETANHGAPCLQQASWAGGATAITTKVIAASPAVAQVPGSGRVDLFARGTDGQVLTLTGTGATGAGATWGIWRGLGVPPGGWVGAPAGVSGGPGNLNVFVRGRDNQLWQRFSNDGGQSWSAWFTPVGNSLALGSSPAVCSWSPGRVDVFVIGTDGVAYHRWFDGGWNGYWERRGTPPIPFQYSALAATSWGPGRIDVFATAGGTLWQMFFDGRWNDWAEPANSSDRILTSAPGAASWGVGQVAVFGQSSGSALYWNNAYQGYWSGWQRLGNPGDTFTGNPAAGSAGCQALNVFVRGAAAGHVREYRYSG